MIVPGICKKLQHKKNNQFRKTTAKAEQTKIKKKYRKETNNF